MVVAKLKKKQLPVYFGHPFQFWKERQRLEMKATVDVEDMKKMSDIVNYDLEHKERMDVKRRQQETLERRRCYDEQIASANKKRQELIHQELEKENIKLEKIKKKMELDHYEAIKKKNDQQMCNKKNFIEGYENKLTRLRNEKIKARQIDNETIRAALEDLRRERERNKLKMVHLPLVNRMVYVTDKNNLAFLLQKSLQMEKQICVENFNRERRMASALEEEADKIAEEWRQIEQEKNDEQKRQMEQELRTRKEKAGEEYKRHIQTRNMELERAKQDRMERMERVKRSAFYELQRKMDSANDELEKQLDYRHALSCQIRNNENYLDTELRTIENKDKPFTKKAQLFKDVMTTRLASSTGRSSTNPVHPFRRIIESKKSKESFLPSIG
ncbi:unnamed protein product [Arctia plantaginis]|uniref:Trichohyalin-plectin-homology domain-containing protein n=1 Tax=Arctia plantaginis TaxID=874455 RepID=A0A8S0ZX52_ARCPL|nr:unnamed protein product [Arctia plantaginis]